MAKTVEFKYAPMFQVGEDKTEYRLLTKEGVTTAEFEGKQIVKVSKEALTLLAQQAFHDVEFMLRREHNLQVAKILNDPEASGSFRMAATCRLCSRRSINSTSWKACWASSVSASFDNSLYSVLSSPNWNIGAYLNSGVVAISYAP